MVSAIFPLPVNGEFSEDDLRFTLDISFVYDDKEKGILVVVPKGFQTDFNSVPQALQAYFPRWQYLEAGLVHDWLYRFPDGYRNHIDYHCEQCRKELQPTLTRGQCDDIHRRILDLKGCRWSKRQAAWLALRSAGGLPWNRYRESNSTVKL